MPLQATILEGSVRPARTRHSRPAATSGYRGSVKLALVPANDGSGIYVRIVGADGKRLKRGHVLKFERDGRIRMCHDVDPALAAAAGLALDTAQNRVTVNTAPRS